MVTCVCRGAEERVRGANEVKTAPRFWAKANRAKMTLLSKVDNAEGGTVQGMN